MFTANTETLGYTTMLISATLMGFVGLFARNISTTGDAIAFTRFAIGTFLIILAGVKLFLLRSVRLSPAVILGRASLALSLGAYVSSTHHTTLENVVFMI